MTKNASLSQGMQSRLVAHRLLVAVLQQQRTVEQAAAASESFQSLAERDRGFVMQLVLTTLRYKGLWDGMLATMMQSPMKADRLDITVCLYMGATQLLLMQVPDHAAVDTSVTLAKRCFSKLSGLVNAVLKRISREGEEWLQKQARDEQAKMAFPVWLWESLCVQYGKVRLVDMVSMHRKEPPTDVMFKHPEQAESWAAEHNGALLMTGVVRLPEDHPPISQLPGFAQGDWWVQDVAATLPVRMLGDISGKNVLDCCAAPGGKTMQLASAGAKVTALDSVSHRMERVEQNLKRTGLMASVELVVRDALAWEPEQLFDAILLDAPCSATGTIRRHPELPWHRQEQDLRRLMSLQRRLLERVLPWLAPGGVLVYATCSLFAQEGEEQVAGLLRTQKDVDIQPLVEGELPLLNGAPWSLTDGMLRTLPSMLAAQGGMDGFFAARMQRK